MIDKFKEILNNETDSVLFYLPVKLPEYNDSYGFTSLRLNNTICHELYISKFTNIDLSVNDVFDFLVSLNIPFFVKLFFGDPLTRTANIYTFHNSGDKYNIRDISEPFNKEDLDVITTFKILTKVSK